MSLDTRYVPLSPLQGLLVNITNGQPLAAGKVKFYVDTSRTTPKDVYRLSGTVPNYTYTNIGSEIDLSIAGTYQYLGDDITPYLFPYDSQNPGANIQLYYITVEDSLGVSQFTREGVPNIASNTNGAVEDITNYIPNSQFLLHNNIAASDVNATEAGQITQAITQIAPGGWTFERPNASSAIDLVTFQRFGSYVGTPSSSPRYGAVITNTTPNPTDNFKDLRIKFNDVNKFASTTQQYTLSFFGQSLGSGSVNVSLNLIKNFGTGGSAQTTILLQSFVVTTSVSQFYYSFTFGTNSSSTIGPNDDDFIQLAISCPTNATFSVVLTDFLLQLGNTVSTQLPSYTNGDFITRSLSSNYPIKYDGSDLYLPVINTPSGFQYDTSAIGRFENYSYSPNGNLLLCDGSQYETSGYSSLGVPYNRLHAAWFNNSINLPLHGTGKNYVTGYNYLNSNILALVVNQAGSVSSPSNGASSPGFTYSNIATGTTNYGFRGACFGNQSLYVLQNSIGAFTSSSAGTSGFTITDIINDAYSAGLIAITCTAASGLAGTYFKISNTSTTYYIWFTVNGSGSDPAPGGTGIRVNLLSSYTNVIVAQLVADAISAKSIVNITMGAGSTVPAGSYFYLYGTSSQYYVWYTVDGIGTDPAPGGYLPIPVSIASTATSNQVLLATQLAINSKYFGVPDLRGYVLKGANGPFDQGPFFGANQVFSGSVGQFEVDQILAHLHVATVLNNVTVTSSTPNVTYPAVQSITTSNIATTYTGNNENRVKGFLTNIYVRY